MQVGSETLVGDAVDDADSLSVDDVSDETLCSVQILHEQSSPAVTNSV